MTVDVFPKPGDDPLSGRRQEKDLNEVHQPLEREQRNQSEGDAIEEAAVMTLERRVEEVPDDLRKR